MSFYGKEYTLERDENFDGFLKAVGLSEEKIAAINSYKPSQKMVQNGDNTYTIITSTPKGPRESTFTPGNEFDDIIGVNETVKTTYTIDGNTVTQIVKGGDKGTATFKKEYNGDELVVTITSDKWDGVARRYYKA